MPINVGRPPVNPAYKVREYNNDKSNAVLNASWEKTTVAPNCWVNIVVTSNVKIDNQPAKIEIYQLVGNQKYDVESFYIPIINSRAGKLWMAKPVKSGNFEEGVYHFKVSVGNYRGETQTPLTIRDLAAQRNVSGFVNAPVKPKVVL